MKGTIDIQIKRKDGSIENRREHNVVFDLQALATKMYYERPYCPMTGYLEHKYISSSTYSKFSLSTREIDTSRPSFPIAALTSISSGSSNVWYTAPITSTISDKYKISSATWTAGEAITLKSIFFPHSTLYFWNDISCANYADGFYPKGPCWRLKPASEVFKFTNTGLNGFATDAKTIDAGTLEMAFVPYKLHDPSERFLFVSTSSPTSDCNWYPPVDGSTLQIKDAATNTVKRAFPLSQFEGHINDWAKRYTTRVINTGTKNFLLQYFRNSSSDFGLHVWEIPDSASDATIPISGTILSGLTSGAVDSSDFSSILIVDNVIGYALKSNRKQYSFAVLHDDLSVEIVPGANAAGALLSSEYKSAIMPYMDTDAPALNRGYSGDIYSSYGTYSCRFFNSTAANFSTPIELAEGDVLTVSYKIEVS